jgi:hypothetical protein
MFHVFYVYVLEIVKHGQVIKVITDQHVIGELIKHGIRSGMILLRIPHIGF